MISPRYITPREADIGIWITSAKQGLGYGKKSLELMFELLKSKGVTRIIYNTDRNNLASIKLANSVGFISTDENQSIRFIKNLE